MNKTWHWTDRKGGVWDIKWFEDPNSSTFLDIYGYPLPSGRRAKIYCKLYYVTCGQVVRSKYAELVDIFVPPEHQGRGVGSYLLDTVIAEVKRREYKGITGWLSKVDDVMANKKFYESKGFTVDLDSSARGNKVGTIRLKFERLIPSEGPGND